MADLLWAKLTQNQKRYLRSVDNKVFIIGGIHVDKERLESVVKKYLKDGYLVILGNLLDEYIPKLEHSAQFKVEKRKVNFDDEKLIGLDYFYSDTKYVVRELTPSVVVGYNGSWSKCIHYNEFYWEVIANGSKFISLSPFVSEKAAREYADRFNGEFENVIGKKYSETKLKDLCIKLSKLSWDWTGQTGAVLTDSAGVVLSYGFNELLPYQSVMMHKGSLKERDRGEVGKNIELLETVHAEMSAILMAGERAVSLDGKTLWVSKFPCPYCARILAKSKIKKVKFVEDYPEKSGYSILAGKI